MEEQCRRTALLLGESGVQKLNRAHVAVFGIGGVGSFAVEALVRAGVGALDLFDPDIVCESNLNRQLIALHSTLGRPKVDVMKARALDITPDAVINAYRVFYSADNADKYDFTAYDYIIDAIDTVTSKLLLIERAQAAGVPVISCMGTGNKLDPTRLEVSDIYKTSMCPLAKVMRYELRKRGVKRLKVVYSQEPPLTPYTPDSMEQDTGCVQKRQTPGSVSFVPSAAVLLLAGEVIKELVGQNDKQA